MMEVSLSDLRRLVRGLLMIDAFEARECEFDQCMYDEALEVADRLDLEIRRGE